MVDELSDENRAATLPGAPPGTFESQHLEVNGVRLHHVVGGDGPLVVLLPGWPHTWWSYRKIMPALAARFRVAAVDIRGMGGSSRPAGGYDKRTMAADVHELVRALGYERAHVVGHDIGAMVAQALAAHHPAAVDHLVLLDIVHPNEDLTGLTLLPGPGQRVDPGAAPAGPAVPLFLWWFAFNQVRELPGRLLAGRMRHVVDWLADYQAYDPATLEERDRAVYARAYDEPEAIEAANRWYQAFGRDVADDAVQPVVAAPTLGLVSARLHARMAASLRTRVRDVEVVPVERAGHYLAEERPDEVADRIVTFLGSHREAKAEAASA